MSMSGWFAVSFPIVAVVLLLANSAQAKDGDVATPQGFPCRTGISEIQAIDGDRYVIAGETIERRELASALKVARKQKRFDCLEVQGESPSIETVTGMTRELGRIGINHVEWAGAYSSAAVPRQSETACSKGNLEIEALKDGRFVVDGNVVQRKKLTTALRVQRRKQSSDCVSIHGAPPPNVAAVQGVVLELMGIGMNLVEWKADAVTTPDH